MSIYCLQSISSFKLKPPSRPQDERGQLLSKLSQITAGKWTPMSVFPPTDLWWFGISKYSFW